MKKDTLYTINKWNRPAFVDRQNQNIFDGFDFSQMNFGGSNGGSYFDQYASNYFKNSGNFQGAENFQSGKGQAAGNAAWAQAIPGALNGWTVALQDKPEYSSDAHNGFSLVDTTLTQGKRNKVGMGLVNSGASIMNKGLESGNGIMALVGGIAGTVGTIINNGWGYKVNEQRLADVNAGISSSRNYFSNASSLDDIKGPASTVTNTDVYEGGVFTSNKASDRNNALAAQLNEANAWANRSVENNVKWLLDDTNNRALASYAAYGGQLGNFGSGALGIMQNDKYLDTINYRTNAIANKNTNNSSLGAFTSNAKTFADGGQMDAAFLDDFSTDPIGAAIRYNRGVEQMQAQREAEAAAAQREQDYMAMQQRLANLETQNQGLQAIMAAQSSSPTPPSIPEVTDTPEAPASSSTPSEAARSTSSGNSNWDYIVDQLRKSGKFNETQIEGIKYNLQRESGIGQYDGGDNGTARGLAQWRGARIPKDMSLEGQTRHLIDTLSNYDGKLHWIGRKNYEGFMNARTPEEAHYWIARGYERPAQRIIDKVKRDSDMSLSRLRAFGGELGTNGTDFTNGLLYIDEGGTHEENPLDGVPMGLDPQGIPNLVEEGETVYNDYVFSDRMQVPYFMYKELGLGGTMKKKGKGMSFADASKKLAQESEQRPNDPISQAGLEASLSKLAEVQETERARKNMEEYVGLGYACGGNMKKYGLGGNLFGDGGALEWLNKNYPQVKHKEVLAKIMDKVKDTKTSTTNYSRRGRDGNTVYDYNAIFKDVGPSKIFDENRFNKLRSLGAGYQEAFDLSHPETPVSGVANSKWKADRAAAYDRLVAPANKAALSDYRNKRVQEQRAAYQKAASKSQAQKGTAQQPASPQSAAAASTPTATAKGSSRGAGNRSGSTSRPDSNHDYGKSVQATEFTGNPYPSGSVQDRQRSDDLPPKDARTQGIGYLAADAGVTNQEAKDMGLEQTAQKAIEQIPERVQQQEKVPHYDTWMRYAPAVGAGLMSMTDLLGLTNKPDYTYADKLEAAANAAEYAPHIEAEPIGNYLTYRPMDIWYEQNALNAQSRATDRALANSSSPSRAAGLLANGYNSQLASGNLYRQALEYNDAKRQAVEDFNRRTNMFNSQMKLEADMANARYHQQAQQFGLSGLAQAAALRDQIDARTGAARAANLSNLFTSLGNIGRENFAMNQINNDRSRRYYGTLSGQFGYKQSGAAYGGKIKKRK